MKWASKVLRMPPKRKKSRHLRFDRAVAGLSGRSFHRFFCCFFFRSAMIQMTKRIPTWTCWGQKINGVDTTCLAKMSCWQMQLFRVGLEHQHENMKFINPAGCRKLPDFFIRFVPNRQCIFPFSWGEREYLHLQQLLGSSEKQLVAELRQAVFRGFGSFLLWSGEGQA